MLGNTLLFQSRPVGCICIGHLSCMFGVLYVCMKVTMCLEYTKSQAQGRYSNLASAMKDLLVDGVISYLLQYAFEFVLLLLFCDSHALQASKHLSVSQRNTTTRTSKLIQCRSFFPSAANSRYYTNLLRSVRRS